MSRRPAPALVIPLYLVLTVLGAALLAPPLTWLGLWYLEAFAQTSFPPLTALYAEVEKAGFSRYFNRSLQFSALLMLYPALRLLKLRQLGPIGFLHQPRWLAHAIQGLLLAAIPMAAMAAIYLGLEWFRPRKELSFSHLLPALGTGFSVALIEELVFRGALFAILLHGLSSWLGQSRRTTALTVIVLSAFFALVHFLKPPAHADLDPAAVTWTSGFWMLGQIGALFADAQFLLSEFIILFLIGLATALAKLRTSSLWLPIGLHAGWVFGYRAFNSLATGSRRVKDGDLLPFVGPDLRTGLASAALILLTTLLVLALYRPRHP
jgi:uncharacterized protein